MNLYSCVAMVYLISKRSFQKRARVGKKMSMITAIIPTLGAGRALENCLSSLAKQTFRDFDIVVVSNGPSLSESDLIRDLRHKTRLIVSEENRGYGSACNMGARVTDAPFLLFLNDDTSLENDCLAELYRSLHAKKDALFQPLILHQYAQQTRAGNPCDVYGAAGLGFYGTCGTGEFYASGAALAMSRTVYDSLGGFDEQLFLYHDDLDISWRARLMGYGVSAARTSFCFHSGGGSSAALPHAIKFYLTQRNRIRVLIKNYSTRRLFTRIPIAISLIIAGAIFLSIKARTAAYLKYGVKAAVWNLTILNTTLAERHVIQDKRTEKDSEIETAMCKTSMDICVLKRHLASIQ